MAISAANLTAGGSGTDASSYATASVTPAANKLNLLSFVSRRGDSVDPAQPTASGCNLTWVVVNSIVFDTTSSSRRRVTTFRGLGASPTTEAITVSCGATQTSADWSLDEFTGADTSGANGAGAIVQSVTAKDEADVDASLTVTLAAFGSTANATFGGFGMSDGTLTSTAGSGFTKIGDSTDADTGSRVTTEFLATNDTSVDMTFSGNAQIGGIAIELRAEVIMFDAASNSGYQAAASTYSQAHVVSTGSNRYLIVGVSMLSLAQTVTSIKWNTTESLTFLGAQNSVSGAARVELWGKIAPTAGSFNIDVVLSGAIASAACAISFTGVHQTSPTEGLAGAQATNVGAADATVDVTTVATNDWVVDQVATDDTAITVGTGQTSRNNVTGAAGSGADSTEPDTTPSVVTMSWTNVAALATWSIVAIALRDTNAASLSNPYSGYYGSNQGF